MIVLSRKETTCYIKNKYKKPKANKKFLHFLNGILTPKPKIENENLKKFIKEWLVCGDVAVNVPLRETNVNDVVGFAEWQEYLKVSLKKMFNIDTDRIGYSLNDGKKIFQVK